jgi:hypothetical protein
LTRTLAPLLLVLVLAGACSPAGTAHAQRPASPQRPAIAQRTETKPMSDTTAVEAEVRKALAEYDASRAASSLQAAADALVREDGVVPPEPGQALALARMQLGLWVEILGRFGRDLEPWFDPDNPPATAVAPPEIDGAQMMPGTPPSAIKDAKIRAEYEARIAENKRRVQAYTAMFRLHAIHGTTLDQAAASLRNARDVLGLPAAEIETALADRRIAAADRKALETGLAQ